MANASLFRTVIGALTPRTTARNLEGAPAYRRLPASELAQLAATGCFNSTFYAGPEVQLDRLIALADQVDPMFVAKTAIYSRERAYMKDMPALLVSILSRRDPALMERVFDRVIDSPRMLRAFVQMMRSGVTGRKSLGSAPKRCVRRWLNQRTDAAIFAASVGNAPSIADVIRMVHPKASTAARAALYGYLIGRPVSAESLPPVVRDYEAFKAGRRDSLPDVPFQMLAARGLNRRQWAEVACRGSWQMIRMNLNTFARHGVFDEPGMAALIAERLRDGEAIARARVFPYQLLAAYRSTGTGVPAVVRRALEDALHLAMANTPGISGQVYVCPDVSGSMLSPITGVRQGSTTAVRCIDVAALVAAAIVRRNPSAEVLPFDVDVVPITLSWHDGVMANTERLAAIGGGGTCVSAPLARLNARRATGALVVIVSDNQSWIDARSAAGTATMHEWNRFRARNPNARMVLIDLQPGATTQAVDRKDIFNVGGFSDQVFDLVSHFASGGFQHDDWVSQINSVVV